MGSDPTRIQFFIRMNATYAIVANSTDSIRLIQRRIQYYTGVPVTKQHLTYRGNHLHSNRTLAQCGVQNDSELQLVCRMRGITCNHAIEVLDDIIALTRYLSVRKTPPPPVSLRSMVAEFLNMMPRNNAVKASAHLFMFFNSSAPQEMVRLYESPDVPNSEAAKMAITEFIATSTRVLPVHTYHLECAPIVFRFYTSLIEAGRTNCILYRRCNDALRDMLDCSECGEKQSFQIPFFRGLVAGLSGALDLCAEKTLFLGTSSCLVADFTYFLIHLRNEIEKNLAFHDPIDIPLCCTKSIVYLHRIFDDLLCKLKMWLMKIENCVVIHGENLCLGGGTYLRLLKGLYSIFKLYSGGEDVFMENLKRQKNGFSGIVLLNAKSFEHDDYNSILEFKELINFQARKHLAMVMLPQMKHDSGGLHKMLINRSDLLAESFEYIKHADPQRLRSGLSVVFNKEEAYGHGVRREWFLLVCQEIVNPQNPLFLACPNDQRRIFPNPASWVNPRHLQYFSFCGRLIALALMHEVQLGIVFDRVFFLQLAGHSISLEDIRDADPVIYRSCKRILEMDPEVVDQDALGLNFVHEVEEMGKRKVFELLPGGKSMVVNSKNRNKFVDSLIKHRFVIAIREQVAHFAQGFSDIMSCQGCHQSFFRCLDLEDLDWMLHGNKSAVSIDDWKAHTDYRGFRETDPQISWFWENVGCMSIEKKRALLFFWTSIKYLPVEGFSGLASRLCIYKADESRDLLPTSRTCFSQLWLPAYPSISIMRDRLNIITQEHVGCSFGMS